MPCSLCKHSNHTLITCNDVSIHNKIDEITSICVRMVNLSENTGTLQIQYDTTELLSQLTAYLKRLSCPMLKSILYNKRIFKYTPNEQYDFDRNTDYTRGIGHIDVSGSKIKLIGKVMYLFLTNSRREYPIEFLKKNYYTRKLWFEQQLYWYAVSIGLSENAAIDYKSRYSLLNRCYIHWIIALKQDSDDLIKQSFDNFRLNAVDHTEYNLCTTRTRNNELNFHAIHNQHGFDALNGVQYGQLEGLYLKKKIMEHLLSLYGDSIDYSYGEGHTIVLHVNNIPEQVPDQQIILSDSPPIYRPQSTPTNLRKLNIDIVLDKQIAACDIFECPICIDTKTDKQGIVRLNCGHEFCGCCTNHLLNDYRSKTSQPACPLCRGAICQITLKNSDILEDKKLVQNLHNICIFSTL